ncbi:hypothetical protein CFP75_09070 [Amycolatopsis alba DSM 44262]|uniref:Uncharacterized protein n=1 Tax=Amycolatopsis alba DSM 44262 TaxID=1125972 RepID=A0A229S1U0_AMYAL|nr:hypothetical protein CFP75_09070 [Amycolatopsis alba DSM 44262]
MDIGCSPLGRVLGTLDDCNAYLEKGLASGQDGSNHSRDPRPPGVRCGLAGRACCESHFRNVEGCESGFRNATSGARAWTVGRAGREWSGRS